MVAGMSENNSVYQQVCLHSQEQGDSQGHICARYKQNSPAARPTVEVAQEDPQESLSAPLAEHKIGFNVLLLK